MSANFRRNGGRPPTTFGVRKLEYLLLLLTTAVAWLVFKFLPQFVCLFLRMISGKPVTGRTRLVTVDWHCTLTQKSLERGPAVGVVAYIKVCSSASSSSSISRLVRCYGKS